MFFKGIKISNWQQFGEIELSFDKRLTILTGSNGSGKTTILSLLARHYGWDTPSLAVPHKNKKTGRFQFFTRWFHHEEPVNNAIGTLEYENRISSPLTVPSDSAAQYHVDIPNKQHIRCFFIPSHRSVFRYQQLANIPIGTRDKQQAFQRVSNSLRTRYFGGNEHSTSFHIKEMLIGWNIFGHGNQDMPSDYEQLNYFNEFENILRKIVPTTLGFRKLSIRNYEVILECDSGDFLIDAASGGLSTLIDIAWQIYMYGWEEDQKYTVLIDEVENHLHPTMQRKILPDLLKAFPNVRFIVSTHAPLVINSSLEANVYALKYYNNKVFSEHLDFSKEAKTATQVLEEVLGVSTTIPIWAEKKLESIVESMGHGVLDESSFDKLRMDLDSIGLGKYMPKALGDVLEQHDKNK